MKDVCESNSRCPARFLRYCQACTHHSESLKVTQNKSIAGKKSDTVI